MCNNLAAICVHDGDLDYSMVIVNLDNGKVSKTIGEITSAIFSEDGRLIIAAGNTIKENIIVFDSQSGSQLNMIKLSFPGLHENVKTDEYRLFTIERL